MLFELNEKKNIGLTRQRRVMERRKRACEIQQKKDRKPARGAGSASTALGYRHSDLSTKGKKKKEKKKKKRRERKKKLWDSSFDGKVIKRP